MALAFTRYLLARVGTGLDEVKYSVLKRFATVEIPRETGYSFYRSEAQFDSEFESVLKSDLKECVALEKDKVRFSGSSDCMSLYNFIIDYEKRFDVPHMRSAIKAVDTEITWFIRILGGRI